MKINSSRGLKHLQTQESIKLKKLNRTIKSSSRIEDSDHPKKTVNSTLIPVTGPEDKTMSAETSSLHTSESLKSPKY
jgi:hypothetical protein